MRSNVAVAGLAIVFIAHSPAAAKRIPADFNGDGFGDAAIGAPGETLGGAANAGAVTIVYGSKNGLSTKGSRFLRQGSGPVGDVAEANDQFGRAIALGDFDDDGKADLAIGAPGENVGGTTASGQVHVLYGAASGFPGSRSQTWSQDSAGIADTADLNDTFGGVLEAGDVDGDGFDDLLIGVPLESFTIGPTTFFFAGAVHVLYGSPSGLSATGSRFVTQPGGPETNGFFGAAIATGPLGPAPVAASGEIGAESPVVDTAIAGPGARVTNDLFQNIPSGRVFAYLEGLPPGVVTNAEPQATISVRNVLIDGQLVDPSSNDNFGAQLEIGFINEVHVGVRGYEELPGRDRGAIFTFRFSQGEADFVRRLLGDRDYDVGFPTCIVPAPNAKQTKGLGVFAGAPLKDYFGVQSGGLLSFENKGNKYRTYYQGDATGIPGPGENHDEFAWSCADYRPTSNVFELLVGTPGREVGKADDAGVVHEFKLGVQVKSGFEADWYQLLTSNKLGKTKDAKSEDLDFFGLVIAASMTGNK